ncbi:hypothetical protein [Rhizohabitans arisaemae]|uniref:hypothetical protein n=1 Tax=Rhizohabitans arisaemae TaxID=2720610 RepID=UPI0024B16EF3|nr:hypothetical protein [Rhizohabitans arisaemae]
MSGHDPYTYVTATIGNGRTRLDVSFHTAKLDVHAFVVGNRRPCLDLSSEEALVSITTTGCGQPVTEQDVALARKIFNAAARYLADCERLHAAQQTDALTALEPDAA